jgi:hypothetical protein
MVYTELELESFSFVSYANKWMEKAKDNFQQK